MLAPGTPGVVVLVSAVGAVAPAEPESSMANWPGVRVRALGNGAQEEVYER